MSSPLLKLSEMVIWPSAEQPKVKQTIKNSAEKVFENKERSLSEFMENLSGSIGWQLHSSISLALRAAMKSVIHRARALLLTSSSGYVRPDWGAEMHTV